jgi:ferredoxin-fold anticodon binding domain-containing protein
MRKLTRKEIQKYTDFAHNLYSDVIDVSVSLDEEDDSKVILKITRGCVLPDVHINREAELTDCIIKQ